MCGCTSRQGVERHGPDRFVKELNVAKDAAPPASSHPLGPHLRGSRPGQGLQQGLRETAWAAADRQVERPEEDTTFQVEDTFQVEECWCGEEWTCVSLQPRPRGLWIIYPRGRRWDLQHSLPVGKTKTSTLRPFASCLNNACTSRPPTPPGLSLSCRVEIHVFCKRGFKTTRKTSEAMLLHENQTQYFFIWKLCDLVKNIFTLFLKKKSIFFIFLKNKWFIFRFSIFIIRFFSVFLE